MPRNPTTALLPSTTVKSRPGVDAKRPRDSTTQLHNWGGAVIGGPGTPEKPMPAGTGAKNIRCVNGYAARKPRRNTINFGHNDRKNEMRGIQ